MQVEPESLSSLAANRSSHCPPPYASIEYGHTRISPTPPDVRYWHSAVSLRLPYAKSEQPYTLVKRLVAAYARSVPDSARVGCLATCNVSSGHRYQTPRQYRAYRIARA
eukprot:203874-Rhodomonas_salina.3